MSQYELLESSCHWCWLWCHCSYWRWHWCGCRMHFLKASIVAVASLAKKTLFCPCPFIALSLSKFQIHCRWVWLANFISCPLTLGAKRMEKSVSDSLGFQSRWWIHSLVAGGWKRGSDIGYPKKWHRSSITSLIHFLMFHFCSPSSLGAHSLIKMSYTRTL